ncbi:Protein polyglycylase TTLL10 (Tubulin--tyrosine ligase-like protein 10) [Durusdinium trenchii]|uniref:Protein polyglycylase TTLL10 (Tubulin--tyrosine ligase-like protein 10) n=1 Tax=Durusdinium trenchii TaxID=1381693 RepID=A0ABP0H5N0_9DINO
MLVEAAQGGVADEVPEGGVAGSSVHDLNDADVEVKFRNGSGGPAGGLESRLSSEDEYFGDEDEDEDEDEKKRRKASLRGYWCCQSRAMLLCMAMTVACLMLVWQQQQQRERESPMFGLLSSVGGGFVSKQLVAESKVVLIEVGFEGCPYTALGGRVIAKLARELGPAKIESRVWNNPTKEAFKEWLRARKAEQQVPETHGSAPAVFSRTDAGREFVGGTTELLAFARETFPSVDLSEELSSLEALNERQRHNKEDVADATAVDTVVEEDDGVAETEERSEEAQAPGDSLNRADGDGDTRQPDFLAASPLNNLEPQVVLKPNKLYTTYRVGEKHVTNYRPMMQFLKARGWQFMMSAPLRASWILVQDQKTAAAVLKKYRKAIINNIGYGGQSCFGGTKGTQLRCRVDFAKKFGCDFDDLHVQPPQYRLWLGDECHKFFDSVCVEHPNKLWMEKPSGGQHGVGMKVRNGCTEMRAAFGHCSGEGRKVIAMPYLPPALIGGHKFDVRSFLLVGSLDPLLAFYHDGFARKAGNKYSSDTTDVNAHITNAESQSGDDHFYEFSRLQEVLHRESGFPPDYMETVFRAHAIKVQEYVLHVSKQFMMKRKGVYQIFALDWIIDDVGGIHMLEANSNPLVTVFSQMEREFTETWDGMVDLVLKIHTDPAGLFSEDQPELSTAPNRFDYRGWKLIYSELEAQANGKVYNPCQIGVQPFSIKPEAGAGQTSRTDNEHRDQSGGLSKAPPIGDSGEAERPTPEKEEDHHDGHKEAFPPASPNAETPYHVSSEDIQGAIRQGASRACVELDVFATFDDCHFVDRGLGPTDKAIRCVYAPNAYFYVIEPAGSRPEDAGKGCHPNVMVTAGVHGNEQAGIVAARHIRKRWRLNKGRLFVIERMNPRGPGKGRYITRVPQFERDLNRNFPETGLVGKLAHDIWRVVREIRPHIFIDLHEGWGFYNRLRQNKGGPLVGNPNFSKGSSVISTEVAQPIAKFMINRVNRDLVPDPSKHFLSIVPPINTGLASMVDRSFASLVMVVETTSKQGLFLRGQQQLTLVGACFVLLGLLPVDFDARSGFVQDEACVAGLSGCKLQHPGDILVDETGSPTLLAAGSDDLAASEESSFAAEQHEPDQEHEERPSAEDHGGERPQDDGILDDEARDVTGVAEGQASGDIADDPADDDTTADLLILP